MNTKVTHLVFALLACCLAAQNIFLLRESGRLKKERDLAAEKVFYKGDLIRDFSGIDRRGRYIEVHLKTQGQNSLLIGFSATCPASLANLSNLLQLSREIDRSRWRVMWLTRDRHQLAKEFFGRHGINDDIVSDFSCRSYNSLGLSSVPRIMAVDFNGKVIASWSGPLTKDVWDEIFSVLLSSGRISGRKLSRR